MSAMEFLPGAGAIWCWCAAGVGRCWSTPCKPAQTGHCAPKCCPKRTPAKPCAMHQNGSKMARALGSQTFQNKRTQCTPYPRICLDWLHGVSVSIPPEFCIFRGASRQESSFKVTFFPQWQLVTRPPPRPPVEFLKDNSSSSPRASFRDFTQPKEQQVTCFLDSSCPQNFEPMCWYWNIFLLYLWKFLVKI